MATPVQGKALTGERVIQSLLRRLEQRRIPVSTYRIQFNPSFKFQEAKELVSYLKRLGITDCYCSPYLAPRPGSTHGYDTSDHNRLNPELGSEEDYLEFVRELDENQMGQVLDFVPNHMGIMPIGVNRWWKEVLENGPCSPFAHFFDIDWEPVKLELKGKVLLPILGDQYGLVLERGELQLGFENGAIFLRYWDNYLPINPSHSIKVYQHNLEALQSEMGDENPHLREYLSIMTALRNLPSDTVNDPDLIAERQREKEVARERLAKLVEASSRIESHIEENMRMFNGEPGRPESFDMLHELLEEQAYRLSYWRTAAHEINYRRFFDINELAGLRMEDKDVFQATHALILKLIREGKVTGLRLDHIDGLFDPKNYLERLQEAILLEWAAEEIGQDGKLNDEQKEMVLAWREEEKRKNYTGLAARPLYVVAEKILSDGENLPERWALHGTSGYDFLNDLNGLFIDSKNEEHLKKIYSRFTGIQDTFSNIVYRSKKNIMWTDMASELNVLAYTLNRISEKNRRSRDFTLNSLRDALAEVVACFFKYRTYINASGWTESDQETIKTAITWARRRNPVMESSIFDFIYDILLSKPSDGLSEEEYRRRLDFTMKFQQYTSPLQAKGVEDTAFYRYNMLTSLNEVGGEPQRFGRSLEEFHESNLRRLQQWPYGMLATATHDTKRGEDVRARLNILSEIPEEWSWQLSKWELLNAANRRVIDEEPAPDRNDEYLFYQTLIGIWPNVEEPREQLIERLRAYMIKATREAKVHTSWINENKDYEEAVCNFIEKTLIGPDSEGFLSSFQNFQKRIAQLGMVNSLSQVVLKITSPGVPDFYQGSELWDLSLVDPDNRQPVDYKRRKELLESMETPLDKPTQPAERLALIAEMLKNWEDGRIKLFTIARGLRLRRKYPELFLNGDYLPLYAEREFENHIMAFARRHENQLIMTIVPRLITNLTDAEHPLPIGGESWKTSRIFLPAYFGKRTFFNLFTGEQVRPIIHAGQTGIFVAEALRTCPVSILVAE